MRLEINGHQIEVNVPTAAALLDELRRRFRAGEGFALATVNLDHLVKIAASADFATAYAAQDLVVADGNPIVWLSRLAGDPVELVPGSDLLRPLAALAAEEGVPVALVGSHESALADAARVLGAAAPGLDIVLSIPPSLGFDPDGDEAGDILAALAAHKVGLCFLALGAPKQERLAARGRQLAPGVGFASIGAGLDFLGGHQRRAPLWVRRIAMEWLWRMMTDIRRLGPRYARSFAILPGQAIKALGQRLGRK